MSPDAAATLELSPAATAPAVVERALDWDCAGERCWGILATPAPGTASSDSAVLIVVGGPQYRVGSHRQFVQLARALARHGHASLRFDCRGMGDSGGPLRSFEQFAPDLRAALDALARACPQARRLVVWGLCDAASAALMFATGDPRVAGIVIANPWVRSDASLAAVQVRHYYGARLLQREFWTKLSSGRFAWRASLAALGASVARVLARRRTGAAENTSFQARMARGLQAFRGELLLILSGNDLTAKEFVQYTASEPAWRGLLESTRVRRVDLPEADHTFSRGVWSRQVEQATLAWLTVPGRTGNAEA